MKRCLAGLSASRLLATIGMPLCLGVYCACASAEPDFSEYEPLTASPQVTIAQSPVEVDADETHKEEVARVFVHRAPAAKIGRIGEKEDIPFLTPYPGSVLIGGLRILGPLDLTILATPETDAPVAGTAVISRNYNGPEDLSRLEFIRENFKAFARAGWTVRYPTDPDSDSEIIIAHYGKDSLDVWARLMWSEGGGLAYSTTDPSPDDWKTMLNTTCRLPLYGIIFDFNKATLRPESEPVLDRTVRLLNDDPALVIEVQGHTDDIGSDDYNLKLSEARAETVRRWLIDHEIDSSRLSSAGYGKRVPVAKNDTDFGRAKNRRVELKRRDCKPSPEVAETSHRRKK